MLVSFILVTFESYILHTFFLYLFLTCSQDHLSSFQEMLPVSIQRAAVSQYCYFIKSLSLKIEKSQEKNCAKPGKKMQYRYIDEGKNPSKQELSSVGFNLVNYLCFFAFLQ